MNLQGNASSVILVPQINLVFVFVLFRNQFLTSRSVSDELLYKSYAKTLKNLLFKARSIYYKNLLDGCINSTKNVWKCLNSLTSSKCKTNSQKITKIVHNNQVFSNESTIPEIGRASCRERV